MRPGRRASNTYARLPGYPDGNWPPRSGMTLEENLADLRRHAEDFTRGAGFTFTVLDPGDNDVIGCVYLYPSASEEWDVTVPVLGAGGQIGPRRTTRQYRSALARHRLALEAGGPLRSLNRNGTLIAATRSLAGWCLDLWWWSPERPLDARRVGCDRVAATTSADRWPGGREGRHRSGSGSPAASSTPGPKPGASSPAGTTASTTGSDGTPPTAWVEARAASGRFLVGRMEGRSGGTGAVVL